MAGNLHPRVRQTAPADLHLDEVAGAHNPHGGGNACDLEIALDQDLLITSVGWANSYYGEGNQYVDEWGVGWLSARYETPYGVGHYTEPSGHPLADADAVARYRPPDPGRPELYTDAEQLIAGHGAEYWIIGSTVTTIFETAWALRGLEQLLTDFIEDPDLADAILDIPYRYHLAAAETLVRMGVDMIWLGDDVGHQQGMFISPRHWRRFLKPRMAHIIERLKSINPGVKVAYHTDGCVYAIIPELIEIGIDVLNPIQPAAMDPVLVNASTAVTSAFGARWMSSTPCRLVVPMTSDGRWSTGSPRSARAGASSWRRLITCSWTRRSRTSGRWSRR